MRLRRPNGTAVFILPGLTHTIIHISKDNEKLNSLPQTIEIGKRGEPAVPEEETEVVESDMNQYNPVIGDRTVKLSKKDFGFEFAADGKSVRIYAKGSNYVGEQTLPITQ